MSQRSRIPSEANRLKHSTQVTLTGGGMISGGSVSLLRPGADPATAIRAPATYVSTTQSTAVLNLVNEAPGKYNVTYTGTSDGVPRPPESISSSAWILVFVPSRPPKPRTA